MKNRYKKMVGIIIMLVLWQILAFIMKDSFLFAGPIEVSKAIAHMVITGEIIFVLKTFLRIIGGWSAGVVIGFIVAITSHKLHLEEYLSPMVSFLKATPIVSVILVILFWTSAKNLPLIVIFVMIFPIIYENTLLGLQSRNDKLAEMIKIYPITFLEKIRYLYSPTVIPAMRSAFAITIGLACKAGVSAEVIAGTINSIGEGIYKSKLTLDIASLIGWTVLVVGGSMILERTCKAVFDKILGSEYI